MQLQKMMMMACALLERTQLQSCFATSLLILVNVYLFISGDKTTILNKAHCELSAKQTKRSRQVIDSQ